MTSGESVSNGRTPDRRRWRSLTTTESSSTTEKLAPIHPGEVLMEDFIQGFGITQNKLAVSIGVPPRRINEIVHGKRAITADTALRLGRYFGVSAQFWLNLQTQYELDLAEDRVADQIAAITPLRVA
ncbi:HigA family addiction module antitoxin [Microbacterium sp. CR_7]